jgi:glycosyltransferase involved in cell wall biosynthesis
VSRLFFDARYIRPEFHDGISRFSANLFAAVSRKADVTAIISDERQLASLPPGTKWVMLHPPTSALEPLSSLLLKKHNPDVVFSPMQTIGSFGKNFKLILTVHDLIYYRHPKPPGYLNPVIRLGWRLFHLSYVPERLLLRGADAVATVSEATRRELRRHRLTKRTVAVLYNAPERSAKSLSAGSRTPLKKLVYMGTFMPYKDVETLIRGVAKLDGFELELLSRIDDRRRIELTALAEEVGAKVAFSNGVTDEEYAAALDSATALVTASRDEGFGIPIVEAMVRGVPVVVSDIPIFREVAGDVGVFFIPGDSGDFAKKVQETVKRPQSAKNLMKQATQFDWDKSADELLKLIASL